MITPLPPQLRPDHPSIVASHARHQMAMDLVKRAYQVIAIQKMDATKTDGEPQS